MLVKPLWKFPASSTRAAGSLDVFRCADGHLEIKGWLLLPEQPVAPPSIFLDREYLGEAQTEERPDVAEALPWVSHAAESGFVWIGEGPESVSSEHVLECVSGASGQVEGYLGALASLRDPSGPVPPARLITRVGSPDKESYRKQGLKIAGDLLHALEGVGSLSSVSRVLDWGCGCGRVTAHLRGFFPEQEIFGVDVDKEAIEWCKEHFPEMQFSATRSLPPTPFEASTFDLVVANSVMTHLHEDLQRSWLKEMRRIMTPGGLFVASTAGKYAFLRFLNRKVPPGRPLLRMKSLYQKRKGLRGLTRTGLYNAARNRSLQGIVPSRHYADFFQTREATERLWSEHFEIVSFIERGLDNFQNLWVLRPR